MPVEELLAHWDPFSAWDVPPVTHNEILDALAAGQLDDRPFDTMGHNAHASRDEERGYHIRRIAWMIAHPDRNPIEIDIGAPSLGWHPTRHPFDFIDGNHRLCAAAIRGDATIDVGYGGECGAFPTLFPGAVPRT